MVIDESNAYTLHLVYASASHCILILFFLIGKILIIHAGGFSQRLPNQSVLGKVFLTLPCGK